MDTIGYYNKYASAIFEQTVEQDMEEQRKTFTEYLEEGDTILDLGCGSDVTAWPFMNRASMRPLWMPLRKCASWQRFIQAWRS